MYNIEGFTNQIKKEEQTKLLLKKKKRIFLILGKACRIYEMNVHLRLVKQTIFEVSFEILNTKGLSLWLNKSLLNSRVPNFCYVLHVFCLVVEPR